MRNFIANRINDIADLLVQAIITHDRPILEGTDQYAQQTGAFDDWNYNQYNLADDLMDFADKVRYYNWPFGAR